MSRVLVAYASKHGSTRELAEAVGETLREAGHEIDIEAAGSVRSLDGYDAVVLGVALYMFKITPEGRKFLSRNKKGLQELPVAIFGSGPTEDKEEDWANVREHFDKNLAKMEWFEPRVVEVFGGKVDPTELKFPFSNMPANDIRDWDAVKAWATSLPEVLGL